ncbi:efflux RND transporter periplasmic adaptor subunit [candidate division KSB1 bacterium]|nr:efflux RND transporter periplasmic adaptor subunit [candidate division KSB1 bacterium]
MATRRKKIIWIVIIVVVILAILTVMFKKSGSKEDNGVQTVKVEKRNILDKALAVGTIDPEIEIAIKSKISGVVKRLFVDAGSFVREGDPLIEIKPDPTPLELAEAKRNVEMAQISLDNALREYNRLKQLVDKGLISEQDYEAAEQAYQEAKLRQEMASERLALIEKGKIKIANTNIETIIKSPMKGYILEKLIDVGDPIVPLTSYQAGTEIFTMADMSNLIFRGTVDEIDVGKLKEDMAADIQVGALPGVPVTGNLIKISLKAQKQDNSTVFPVEIKINRSDKVVLRAGYSANANIIIQQKDSVLTVPERVVTFRDDSAFVNIPKEDGTSEEIYIETGMSDAIYVEVKSGLEEGQDVLEKKVKEII